MQESTMSAVPVYRSRRYVAINSVNMSDEMMEKVVEVANDALEKFNRPEQIASCIEDDFNKKYYAIEWECIVRRRSPYYTATVEKQNSIHFDIGGYAILLYNKNSYRITETWGLSCCYLYSYTRYADIS